MSRRCSVALCLLFVFAGPCLALQFVPFQLDDAYITYRYVAHFLDGAGIAYNRGGEWVEGFSSPFWFLTLSGLAAVFGTASLPTLAPVLGVAAQVVVLVLTWRITSSRDDDVTSTRTYWGSAIALGLVALNPCIAYYAVTGLEMVLFLVVVLVFAGAAAGRLPLTWGLAAGGLSPWVRPEAGWFPVMLVAQLLGERRVRRINSKPVLALIASVVVGGIAVVGARMALFGTTLPNAFYAKQSNVVYGLYYTGDFLAQPWVAGIVMLGFLGALVGGRSCGGFFVGGISWLLAATIEGGDWMPMGRMLLPALALMAPAAAGLASPVGLGSGWLRRFPRVYASVVTMALGGVLVLAVNAGREEAPRALGTIRTLHHDARVLRGWVVQSGAKSIGLVDIGVLGYRTDLEVVDFAGLTDSTIAHSEGDHLNKNFDLAYLFERRRPDVIVLRTTKPPRQTGAGPPVFSPHAAKSHIEARIMRDRRLTKEYRLSHAILPAYRRRPYYGLVVYARRDFDPGPEATSRLPPAPPHGVVTLHVPRMRGPLRAP